MADAGRILIIPKGDYDANSTYDKLDLVKYKGTSWLAKKVTTGNEPSEANAEYWQDMFEPNIANNLTTTEEGYALDARQGKILNDILSGDLLAKGSIGVNANTYTTNGIYMWYRPNDWSTLNFPNEYGIIQVLSSGTTFNSYVAQIALSFRDDRIYKRSSSNGGAEWSTWRIWDAFIETGAFNKSAVLLNSTVNLKRNGSVKQLHIMGAITTVAQAWNNLGTLPVGYRPSSLYNQNFYISNNTCLLYIQETGAVLFYTPTSLTNAQVYLNITFI